MAIRASGRRPGEREGDNGAAPPLKGRGHRADRVSVAVKMRDRNDRSIRAFLRAIRAAPGFGLRVVAMTGFALSMAAAKGVRAMIGALLLGAVLGFVVGYALFRRSGRIG